MNEPERNADVERQIAAYERRLREQLFREQELAELAAQQRVHAQTTRFLPMLGGNDASQADCGAAV